jgi:hypothetical protein
MAAPLPDGRDTSLTRFNQLAKASKLIQGKNLDGKLRMNSNPPATPPPREREHAQAQAVADAPGQSPQNQPNGAERRNHARYPVSADAVIVEPRSRTKLRGRASDLSLSGCYLDAINLFPVGTPVRLRLTAEARAFECQASVTYSMPGMGMGLAFTNIPADQSAALRNWIAELSGEPTDAATAAHEIEFETKKPAAALNFGSWQEAFSELVTILHRKGLLAESEIETLRNKLPR